MLDARSDGAGVILRDEIRKQRVTAVDSARTGKVTKLTAHAPAVSGAAAGEQKCGKREETGCAAKEGVHQAMGER
jgi:hypothetical protein